MILDLFGQFETIEMHGEVAEWLKAAVSKAVISGDWYRGFESHPLHIFFVKKASKKRVVC